MCKEDIRLARNTDVGQTFSGASPGDNVAALKPDPNRYSLLASAIGQTAVANDIIISVYSKGIGGVIPLMTLTNDHPSDRISLVDVGNVLTGAIFLVSRGTNNSAVQLADGVFTDSIEDL